MNKTNTLNEADERELKDSVGEYILQWVERWLADKYPQLSEHGPFVGYDSVRDSVFISLMEDPADELENPFDVHMPWEDFNKYICGTDTAEESKKLIQNLENLLEQLKERHQSQLMYDEEIREEIEAEEIREEIEAENAREMRDKMDAEEEGIM